MHKKIRLGVLFGGKSAEHEVSLLSAKNVLSALDREKYEIVLIGIDKNGQWHRRDEAQFLLNASSLKGIQMDGPKMPVTLVQRDLFCLEKASEAKPLDVVLPILHGTYGEDGTIQGLLKLAGVPFVGASVLGSAIGMDKDVMKRLLRDAGIPIPKFFTFHQKEIDYLFVQKQLGLPFFIKPTNLGSSIGISKVKNEKEFQEALEKAFSFDHKIMIEEFIEGREIECGVLGNEHPIASLPGEALPQDEFYSYRAKYVENGVIIEVPARISAESSARIQALAIKTYQTLCCEGMARVDFFLKPEGAVYVNEINTIPGFTATSAFPQLWEASGIQLSTLLDRVIHCALERFEKEKSLKTQRGQEYV